MVMVVAKSNHYHHLLFASITFPDSSQFRVPLNRVSPPIDHVNFETWIGRTESLCLPGFDGNIVFGGAVISVLRQSLAVAAHVGTSQVKDAHTKTFNAPNLSLNVGNRGHFAKLDYNLNCCPTLLFAVKKRQIRGRVFG
jgi:hypothetical protein